MKTTKIMNNIYIVTCDKINFFRTFKSMDELLKKMGEINKTTFDGGTFSIFGQPSDWDTGKDLPYLTDSIVLCSRKYSKAEYFTFMIHCINKDGQITEISL